MRHETLSRTILQFVAEAGTITLGAFFVPHPRTRLARALLGLDPYKRYSSPKAAKHSFSTLLYHLKKDGLVSMRGPRKKAVWSITKKGSRELRKSPPTQRRAVFDELPPEDGVARLVAFDVPENQRKKRQWLRTVLIACGFGSIQRSVFLGRRPLPEDVITEIHAMGMDRYIHIVSIQKSGTLRAGKQ